ncbi:MAG: helix-turn-helix domain-containing protein [Pseudonocardia sp.]
MARQRSQGQSNRDELTRLLVFIRGDRTQMDAATVSGLSQAKISRAERGRFPLSPQEADRYAERLGATSEQRRRLVDLAAARSADQISGRVALVRVAAAVQERIERHQRDAALIRAWQPDLVPGVLQTTEYTATLLAGDGEEGDPGPAWWNARRARTAMLHDPSKTWHLLVSEAALRWPLGSARTMQAQLEHLVDASLLPNVRLGVLDLATPKPFAPPAAFHMYDRIVSVATEVGTSFLTDAQDVDHFDALFARLDEAALHAAEARALLTELAQNFAART